LTSFSAGIGLACQSGGFGTQGALSQGFEAVAAGKICHYEAPPDFSPPFSYKTNLLSTNPSII
jgi:hypothetical protein